MKTQKVDKHAGGRPPKYTAAEEMQLSIDAFFLECEAKLKPATIAGLTLAIGFTSKNQLYEYEKKEEFKYCIKKARMRLESEVESRLFGANATGSIFWLKNNAAYRDEQHQRHSFDFSKLSDEELEAIAAGQSEA